MIPVAGIHAEIHQLTSSEDTARTFLMSRIILRETMTCPCTTPPTDMLLISCTSSKSSDLFIWKCPACKSFKNIRQCPFQSTVEPSQPPSPHRDNRSEEPTTTSQPPKKRQRRTTSRDDIEQFHTGYAQVLSIFTGTGSRTNAIKDARISKSTFYLNKAITELHIVKPEVFQQEVHSAITNNLQLRVQSKM